MMMDASARRKIVVISYGWLFLNDALEVAWTDKSRTEQ